MKTLSIVCTQLQLINAIECVKYYQSTDNTLILDCASRTRRNQLENLLSMDIYKGIFNKVYYSDITNNRFVYIDMIFVKILILLLVSLYKYQKIIVGNYNLLKHKYAIVQGISQNKSCRAIVVDDGTVSLLYPEIREKEISSGICDISYENSRFSRMLYHKSLTDVVSVNINFFSLYKLQLPPSDNLIENHFKYLTDNLNNVITGIDLSKFNIVVVGQPLIELNAVSNENYQKCILEIRNQNEGNMLYVSHPAEFSYPFADSGVKIIKFPLPFECMVKLLNPDTTIYGFTSSALINAKLLCPEKRVVAIDLSPVLIRETSFIEVSSKIYSSFKDYGIEIILYK